VHNYPTEPLNIRPFFCKNQHLNTYQKKGRVIALPLISILRISIQNLPNFNVSTAEGPLKSAFVDTALFKPLTYR
jgi:hypothetical protein